MFLQNGYKILFNMALHVECYNNFQLSTFNFQFKYLFLHHKLYDL